MIKHKVKLAGATYRYRVYIPDFIKPPYSTILFLHGKGECGTDGLKMTQTGLGPALQKAPKDWPFLVVFPQKAVETQWRESVTMVQEVMNQVLKEYEVDKSQTYLTGLSQGGTGVLELADQLPISPAAIAAVCGASNPHEVRHKLMKTPLRLYHGMKDDVIAYENTVALAKELSLLGPTPTEVILYPSDGHNSWDRAYQDSGLAAWFLRHSLAKGGAR